MKSIEVKRKNWSVICHPQGKGNVLLGVQISQIKFRRYQKYNNPKVIDNACINFYLLIHFTQTDGFKIFEINAKCSFCFDCLSCSNNVIRIINVRAANWGRFARKATLLRISPRVKGIFGGVWSQTGRSSLTFNSTWQCTGAQVML